MNNQIYKPLTPLLQSLGFLCEEVETDEVDERHGRKLEEITENFHCTTPEGVKPEFLKDLAVLHYQARGYTHNTYLSDKTRGNSRLEGSDNDIDVWIGKYCDNTLHFTIYLLDKT